MATAARLAARGRKRSVVEDQLAQRSLGRERDAAGAGLGSAAGRTAPAAAGADEPAQRQQGGGSGAGPALRARLQDSFASHDRNDNSSHSP